MKIFGLEIKRAAKDSALAADTKDTPSPDEIKAHAQQIMNDLFGWRYTAAGWINNSGKPLELLRDGYGSNTSIFAMIDIMAKKLASVPWIMYQVKSKTKAAQYKALTMDYTDAGLQARMRLKASAFDEVESHKIIDLWEKPNSYQTAQSFREQLVTFLKTTGAAPVWANKGKTKIEPLELHSLPTQWIRLQPSPDLFTFSKAFYTITGEQIEIPIDEFLYWKYVNPNFDSNGSHIYGLPPLKAGSKVLESDNQNMEAQAFQFANKGATGVFTPKDKDGMIAATAQQDKLRKAVDDRANGREYNKARTLINFPLEYHTFGMTAVEMESIAAHVQSKESLANIFNFPAYLLLMAKGTDSKYTEAIKYLVTNTIYSDLTGMRAWLNEWYLPMFGKAGEGYYWDFDITALPELQEDMQKLVTSLKDMWWITPNEKRVVSKYDALADPNMNQILVLTGYQPLSSVFESMGELDENIL